MTHHTLTSVGEQISLFDTLDHNPPLANDPMGVPDPAINPDSTTPNTGITELELHQPTT